MQRSFLSHREVKADIERWRNEAKVDVPVMCKIKDNNITIYTTLPGYLIGKGGQLINKYIQIFKNKYGEDIKINIIETELLI